MARRLLHDPQMAEDVAQEVFLDLCQHAREFESEAHLVSWLCLAARHRAIGVLRQAAVRRAAARLLAPADAPLTRAHGDAESQTVSHLLTRLSPEQRECLRLRAIEGFTVSQIAALRNEPEETVKSRLARSKQILRRAYGIDYEGAGGGGDGPGPARRVTRPAR